MKDQRVYGAWEVGGELVGGKAVKGRWGPAYEGPLKYKAPPRGQGFGSAWITAVSLSLYKC